MAEKQPWIEPEITELAPFAIKTGDPLFNPRRVITVNGYRYAPVSFKTVEAAEAWTLIEALTADEASAVNVLCPNPDFNGQANYAIECCGDWTGWSQRRFAHDNRIECFRMALAAMREAKQ